MHDVAVPDKYAAQRISVYLPRDIARDLHEIREERGIPLSRIVASAIRQVVSDYRRRPDDPGGHAPRKGR